MKKEIYETPECVMLELNVSSSILSSSIVESYSESEENDWVLGEMLN